MNLLDAKQIIGEKLVDVSEVSSRVLRGVRRRGNQDFAAYVFDFNDKLPDTVGELHGYLDEVVGPSYFDESAPSDLRWNSYLYFVVGRDTASAPRFGAVKQNLESDRGYARKYVVFEDELERIVSELDSVAAVAPTATGTDVLQTWSDKLDAIGLVDVLDAERPIADIVRGILSSGQKGSTRSRKTSGAGVSQQLISAHLASIDLRSFREFPKEDSPMNLGKATLLFGSNGVGKTSFLEGIEFLYCGANRRSERQESRKVNGVLANGLSVSTTSQQLLSDFKTRQRLWYGSDDASRLNKLPNQFARFNFLNTDAAAELSLLKGEGESSNTDSLMALLSGHEASQTWKRIRDLRKAVTDAFRAKRAERAVANTEHKANVKELEDLQGMPRDSDAAFAVFAKSLEQIGWREPPSDKRAVSERLVESLTTLASKLHIVRRLDWVSGPVSAEAISTLLYAYERADRIVSTQFAQLEQEVRRYDELQKSRLLVGQRRVSLDSLPIDGVADLLTAFGDSQAAAEELTRSAAAFSVLPTVRPPVGWESAWGSQGIETAFTQSEDALVYLYRDCNTAKEHLASAVAAQSKMHHAMTELQNWARQVIEHLHTDERCPVCGSEFEPGELLRRMERVPVAPSSDVVLALKREVDELSERVNRVEEARLWLSQLADFWKLAMGSRKGVRVDEALAAAASLATRQLELTGLLQASESKVSSYSRMGLRVDEIRRLCAPVGEGALIDGEPLDVKSAAAMLQREENRLRDQLEKLELQMSRRRRGVGRLLSILGINADPTMAFSRELVLGRLRDVQQASEACSDYRQVVSFDSSPDLRLMEGALEDAILGSKRVLATLKADLDFEKRFSTVQARLIELDQRLARTREEIQRLMEAQQVLGDVIDNHSLEAASAAVVAATHEVANKIFERIHSPREYRVTADSNAPLARRSDNSLVHLNEVSTGQRAAYALAMFLAMNAQVRAGPKVLLLDDPISHIDDLNALSFLDYLRNLVLNSDRQVLFATADEKVAALFAHKFGFLGDEFKIIELARG